MIKSVTIVINASTEQAAKAIANRIVNTVDNLAEWANTNHPGLVDSIVARTQDVTVVSTKTEFIKDANGTLVVQ